jgi:hypothetical protein
MFFGGIIVGMCGVIGSQLVAGRFEPLHIPWRPLPPRIETLARWGKLSPVLNPVRLRRQHFVWAEDDEPASLPIRIPGASLSDVPPEDMPLHTNDVSMLMRPRWLPAICYVWWLKTLNRITITESDEAFAKWWEDVWVSDRKRIHHGRHRLSERDDELWRTEWAEYDTQRWPTLSTTGNAWDVIANEIVICRSTLRNIPAVASSRRSYVLTYWASRVSVRLAPLSSVM